MVDRAAFDARRTAGLRLRQEQRLARAEVRVAVKLARALGRADAAEEIAAAVKALPGLVERDIVLTIAAEVGARLDDD